MANTVLQELANEQRKLPELEQSNLSLRHRLWTKTGFKINNSINGRLIENPKKQIENSQEKNGKKSKE